MLSTLLDVDASIHEDVSVTTIWENEQYLAGGALTLRNLAIILNFVQVSRSSHMSPKSTLCNARSQRRLRKW